MSGILNGAGRAVLVAAAVWSAAGFAGEPGGVGAAVWGQATDPDPAADQAAEQAALALLGRFRAAGLAAAPVGRMEPKDYGMAPYVCVGVRFLIASLGADSGGRVFVCPSEGDRDLLRAYFQTLGRISAMAYSWTYVNGLALVQINGALPAKTAARYGVVVQGEPAPR